MSERSLKHTIMYTKMLHDSSGRAAGPHDCNDYADLGESDLPPNAAVHLADMTGDPVGSFEADEYDHPDFDELEVEFRD